MYFHLIVWLFLIANPAFGVEQCEVNSAEEFYSYVKENGPIFQEIQKRKLHIATKIDVAKQRPNPQVDMEYLKGEQLGLNVNNYRLSAKHIVEFGSKREKRIQEAKTYKELKEKEVELAFYQENIKAILNFQRVAQLEIVIETIEEAIHTFDEIVKKLSSRKRLNPNESVALSTLKFASSDYQVQLNNLRNEKTVLEGRLQFLMNCKNIKPMYKNLKFKSLNRKKNHASGLLEIEDLKVSLAQKELEVQNSLGYSNIAIGPSLEYQNQGDNDFSSIGIAVSFALPFFHTNDGGKIESLKAINHQKLASNNNKNMLKIQRSKLLEKYERSLRTLRSIPKLSDLRQEHKKVEKLFSRGVVSIQMTIESHRQQVEFLQSRFETENDALDTLGKLSLIDGDLEVLESLL